MVLLVYFVVLLDHRLYGIIAEVLETAFEMLLNYRLAHYHGQWANNRYCKIAATNEWNPVCFDIREPN